MIHKYLLPTLLLTSPLFSDVTATDVEGKYANKSTSIGATSELVQNINLGFANTAGNTKTLNLNAKYTLEHLIEHGDSAPFKYNFQATGFLTKNDGTKIAEEYTALLNGEQELLNSWLGYVAIGWLRNEFKNFDNKYTFAIGVGKVLIDDGAQRLVVKIGPAYNIEQYTDGTEDAKFGSLNEYLEYSYIFNPTSTLYIKLGAMENFEDMGTDYEATGLVGLNFALNENISISLEHEIAYDNLPVGEFEKTDTKSIARVGYKF